MRVVGSITKPLFAGLPERDPLERAHFGRCAIVASAGILRLRRFGRIIDAHDAVLRFNSAQCHGEEEYVGNKTTLRLVNRENFGWREKPEELTLQHITTETMLREFTEARKERPDEPFLGIDPAFYKRVITGDNTHPTNGYFGIKLALELCDCIYLFGFVRQWHSWMTYHYHDDYVPRKSQAKRDSSEYPLIKKLLKENSGRIVFAHPCILDDKCEGCPEGARCEGGAPYPLPAPGYCFGHGSSGGRPKLKPWVAREYWAGAKWSVQQMATGGKPQQTPSKPPVKHPPHPAARRAHVGRRLLDDEQPDPTLNDPRPGIPYGDERRSCFRKCLPGEDCAGGADGICSDTAAAQPCNPWSDFAASD